MSGAFGAVLYPLCTRGVRRAGDHAGVNVTVTFDSLCALTRLYARDPAVADSLCAKLRKAATSDPKTRNSLLDS